MRHGLFSLSHRHKILENLNLVHVNIYMINIQSESIHFSLKIFKFQKNNAKAAQEKKNEAEC